MRKVICIVGIIALIAAIMVMPAAATTVTISPSDKDCSVMQWNDANKNSDYITVKSFYDDWESPPDDNERTLIHFDLSSLPSGATITSATLHLWVYDFRNAATTTEIYRLTADWTETGPTWSNQPGYDPTVTDSITTGTEKDVWNVWDVTTDVQAFVDGTPNYGWLIKDVAESSTVKKFVGYRPREWTDETERPYLEVTYTEGAAKPDLNVTAITTPANIFATQSNSIDATIKNTGTGAAGAFNVSLSADGTVVDRTGVAGLDAGNSREVTFEWTPAAPGTYELCVVADCDGVIDESDETNNVTCRSVYATQPGNVVYFVPEDSGASYGNGVDIDLMADVNDANPVTATSVNFTFDPNCVNVTNWAGNTSVWAGGTTSTILWSIPQGFIGITTAIGGNPAVTGTVPLGTLTLHCNCTEYCKTGLNFTTAEYTKEGGGTIYAAKEDGTFTCENAPDLVVSDKSEEWIDMVDKTYKVHYTVKNEGNADAGVSNVSLTVDGVEKETKQVSALTQGAEEAGTFDTTLAMSGENDTIRVCADCNDEVFEFNEGNNCMENEWTSALKVDIGDYVITPGSTVKAPITVYGIQNYGTGTINVEYNPLVAQVTKVESSSDSTVTGSTIDNSAGIVSISAWNVNGTSGDVIFAYVTFKAVGTTGSSTALDLTVSELTDTLYNDISTYTDSGSLTIREDAPPVVSNPTATPDTILNDNGRARVPGTNVSELSVYVTDATGANSVTIDLSPIRGPGFENVSMALSAGNNQSGTWSVTTNADYDPGVDQTHCLAVNATDISGNSNTGKCISLTVLRRGDVVRNNAVTITDAYYIAQYTVGIVSAPDEFVAGVVPADSYNGVTMADALYIARYFTDPGVLEDAP